jgi:hypothetical protein
LVKATEVLVHDDRDPRDAVRDDPTWNNWDQWPPASPLAPVPKPEPARSALRRYWWLTGAAAILALGALWMRWTDVNSRTSGDSTLWNIELASNGTRPVTALVFGQDAGIHLVRVPVAGSAPDERGRIPVRLARGNVYLMSLGRDGLDVSTASPPGSPPMAFTAHARFVKLVKSPRATGIQTGWW